jgi:2-oxoglutarate dehydrogenase complex dehydrogenase (E1) component-like enzyme
MKTIDLLRLKSVVHIFRNQGHQIATLDPLMREWGSDFQLPDHWKADPEAKSLHDMMNPSPGKEKINLKAGGFSSDVTVDTKVPHECLVEILGPHWSSSNYSEMYDRKTVGNILETMYKSYCCNVSAEYTHVQCSEEFNWLSLSLEKHRKPTIEERIHHYGLLVRADSFEQFLKTKYKASKRFGLLGCESLVPGLHALCYQSSLLGVEHIELGMAHRGRLSILCNVLNKPLNTLFDEFNDDNQISVSDVKYHLGARATLIYDEEEEEEGGGGGGDEEGETRSLLSAESERARDDRRQRTG